MPIELTPRQRLVLRVADFYYHDGIDAIASVAKLKPHAVRYDLQEMSQKGVFVPCMHFNESCFGYYIFHVHLSVNLKHITALENAFKRNSKVAYLGRQSGERALGVTILSKKPEDLFETIDAVGAQARVPFERIGWCIEGEFYYYGARCVVPDKPLNLETIQNWQGERLEIDLTDAKLIQVMKRKRLLGAAQVARALGVACSTVQYRLRRLQERGAILPRVLLIDYGALGFSAFEVLIRCVGSSKDATDVLRAFCKSRPEAAILIRCFGDWDFKIALYGRTLTDALDFEEALQRALGGYLASSFLLPIRGVLKSGDFPVEDYE